MRICANAPTQYAIQTALGGYQSIKDLVLPTGRLHKQMNLIYDRLTAIPGVSCVRPKGALYLFPKIDLRRFDFKDDQDFVFELLAEQKVLLVAGTGFNYVHKDHFRIVFLASEDELNLAANRIEQLLDHKRIHSSRTVEEYLV